MHVIVEPKPGVIGDNGKPSAPRYPLIWHHFQAKKEREPLQEYPRRKLLTLANASFVGQSLHTQEK
jgi:hypothetical protein